MRLIDADKLKERLMAKVSGFTYKTIHIDDVVAYIDGSPTVEGESVVRCKECKYAEDCEQMVVFENGRYITSGYKLDFCSYGERKESE